MTNLEKLRAATIQDMQMCALCSPGFDRKKNILAHELGLHVRIEENVTESSWDPLKGHPQYDAHLRHFDFLTSVLVKE